MPSAAEALRVLLVEDNPGDVRLVKEHLRGSPLADCDLQVEASLSGGLEHLAGGSFHAVLLDLGLPDSEGLNSVRAVREAAGGPAVVVLTGLADEAAAVAAVQEGAQDYLMKDSLDQDGLVRSLRLCVERQRAERALQKSEEKFSKVFEASPLPISLSTAEEGRILEANRAFADLLGNGRDELVGRTVSELGIWAGDRPRDEVVRRLMESEVAQGWEGRLRTRGGDIRDVRFYSRTFEVEGRTCLLTVIQDFTEQKALQEELRRRALHDALTGLPNRSLFESRLEQAAGRAKRTRSGFAVLFIDLDGFKAVNDSFGHDAGDRVLGEAARRLQGCFRQADTLARVGGDEFAALIEEVEGAAGAMGPADRVTEAMEEPFTVDGHEVRLSASIGISDGNAEVGTPADFLRYADIAMYRVKGKEGTNYGVFDPGRDRLAASRIHRENDLRRAIEGGGARSPLPAHHGPAAGDGGRCRGPGAVGAPAGGSDAAGRVHPSRRGVRPRRPHGAVGAAGGVSAARGVA